MDVKDRIQEYIDIKGINVFSFEKSIGCSNGYWRKTKSISANILSDITRIYSDLSIDWAVTGKGSMLKPEQIPSIKERLLYFLKEQNLWFAVIVILNCNFPNKSFCLINKFLDVFLKHNFILLSID